MSESEMILENQIFSEEFFRKTIQYVKPEYFRDKAERCISDLICGYSERYSKRPSIEALTVDAARLKVNQGVHDSIKDKLGSFSRKSEISADVDWLVNMCERWCKESAVANAIDEAISSIDDSATKKSNADLVELFTKATSITFDSSIGHDYLREAESQYDFYTKAEHRIPFHLPTFNKITKGGITKKTLTVFMSSKTGGFKSGTLCDFSAQWFLSGYNVLYVTLEMSENRIRERIDANLMGINIDDLRTINKEWYTSKVKSITDRTPSRIIIKEYPTSSIHTGHIRHILKELEHKENFVPDIVVLDYLNIMAQRGLSRSDNLYSKVKENTEEFRGLAVERNFAAFSATQSGRQGVKMGDNIDVDDVSESYGLPVTVDLMLAIISNKELEEKGLLMFKQLKNRYDDVYKMLTFVLGVDKAKMTLFEPNSQAGEQFVPPSAKIGSVTQSSTDPEENKMGDWRF